MERLVQAGPNLTTLGILVEAEKLTEQRKGKLWRNFQGEVWRLHVGGASNSRGARVGIMLITPEGTMHENVLTIGFSASNNKAEYEALVSGLKMAKHLGAETMQV